MNRYLLIIAAILLSVQLHAQALIGGQVKDAKTGEGIAYVSVRLAGTFIGASTDQEGFFTINIPSYDSDYIFSFHLVGYTSTEMSLVQLMKEEVVYMEVNEQEIGEVLVQPQNALLILEAAKAKIPDNYYSEPMGQHVFYNQTLLTNGELSIVEEGRYHILNTFHRQKLAGNNVVVKKARGFVDMSAYDVLGKLVANSLQTERIKIAESAEIVLEFNPDLTALEADKQGVFGENAYKNYDFNYIGLAIKEGVVLHMIEYKQKEDVKKTLFDGMLWIDTSSLAIVEIEAKMSMRGVEVQKFLPLKYRLLAKLAGFKIYIENVAFTAKYKQSGDYWVIDEGTFNMIGEVSRRKSEVLRGDLNLHYVVLNNFDKQEFYNLASEYHAIPSSLKEFEDENFWEGNNYIPLGKEVEEALNRRLTAK